MALVVIIDRGCVKRPCWTVEGRDNAKPRRLDIPEQNNLQPWMNETETQGSFRKYGPPPARQLCMSIKDSSPTALYTALDTKFLLSLRDMIKFCELALRERTRVGFALRR